MSSKKTDRPLTPKQEAFVREYLVDFNATQAAIRAGYSDTIGQNGKANHAQITGSQLKADPRVQAKIEEELEKRNFSLDRILNELAEISFGNETHQRDKINAMNLLLRVKGAYRDRQEITGKDGAPIVPVINFVNKNEE